MKEYNKASNMQLRIIENGINNLKMLSKLLFILFI
jgi:hypothetical protein